MVPLKRTCQKWLMVIMTLLCIGGSMELPHVAWADPVNQAGTSINNEDSKGNKRDDYSTQSKAHEDKEKKDKDEEEQAGQWLNTAMENDNKWVQFCDLFTWAGHGIGWAVVRIVYTLSQGAENIIDSIFTLGGLLEDPSIVNITTKIQWLGFGVMALVLLFLFFKWMTGKPVDMKNVMIQMILGTCLIFATTNFVVQGLNTAGGLDLYSWAFNLSKQNYDGFKDDSYFEKGALTTDATASNKKGESSSFSFNAIKANTMDLQYVLSKGNANDLEPNKDGKFKSTGVNDLTPSDFRVLDMIQLLKDPDKLANPHKDDNKKIGKYLNYRVDKDKDGNYIGEKIHNFLKFFPQGYFRFGFHFSRIIVTLLVMMVAFVLAAFNIGTTILELVFLKILSPITIASDIETGKRMKQILMDIWKAWLTITLTGFSLSLFTRIFSFISGLDLGILAYTVALLVSAKVCYDGSNMIKKYFGTDVGVQSGWKTLLGVSSVGHMVHDGASAISTGAHAVTSGVGRLKDKLSGDSSDYGQELDQEDQKATHSSGKSSGEEALDREDGLDLKDFDGGEVMAQEKDDALDSENKDGTSEDDVSPLETVSDEDELDTLSNPTDDLDSDEAETDELDQDPMMNGATEDIDALDDDEDQDNDTISATADMDNQLGDEWDMEDQPTNITEMDDDLDNDTIQADNQMEDTLNQSNLDQSPLNQDIQESISEASPNIDETVNTMDHVDSMNQESASQVMNENHAVALDSATDVAHPSESTATFQSSSHVVAPDGHDSSVSPSANMTIGTHDTPVDNSSSLTSMAMDQARSMDDIFSSENMNQYIHRPYHHSVPNGTAGKADNPNLEDK